MTKTQPGKLPLKKLICTLVGIVICAVLCLCPAPQVLADAAEAVGSTGSIAMRILGITLMAICWWAGEVMPDWLVTIVMLLLWVVLGQFSFTSAFSSFGGTSVWLIVGAFCLAAAVSRTGFFKRISWFLIRLFSPTFRGQVLAMLLVGTVCAPLVPSATAKAVLGATIANNIAEAMGYEPNSRGRCGLFVASFIGFAGTTPAFLSGSIFTYTLLGALPMETQAAITWTRWLLYSAPWLAIVLVGSFFAIQFLFTPKGDGRLTSAYVQQEYAKLGTMGTQEKLSALFLVLAITLWILEAQLGISAAVTALGVAVLCFASGILDGKDISTAVPWGLVIFLGGVLNLGSVFSKVGLDVWLEHILMPVFSHINSTVLFLVVVAVITMLLRLILVSQSATIIIMLAVLTSVAKYFGISPYVVGWVVLAMEGSWFLSYQNVVYTPALSCMEGTVAHKKTVLACALFEALSLLGCLASIPLWKLYGLI